MSSMGAVFGAWTLVGLTAATMAARAFSQELGAGPEIEQAELGRIEGVQIDGAYALGARLEAPLTEFTLDIMLQSDGINEDPPPFDDVSPQMPFQAGDVDFYLYRDFYLILFGSEEDRGAARIGDPDQMTRLTMAAGPDGVVFYINGGEAMRSNMTAGLRGLVRLGVGFRQRYWKGQVAFVDIYDGLATLGEFDPAQGRFGPANRVLSLEQLESLD